MIKFEQISKNFKTDFWAPKVQVLNELSFSIDQNCLVGFLGPNGSGKTTSLKILMRFIKPSSGKIIISKHLGSNFKKFLSNVGFMPERPYFYPHLTGLEFLNYMGSLSDVKKSTITQMINKWAPRFNIEYAMNRKINDYSKGMLQRLGFVSVLVHDPKLLILDEPLSGLDPIGRKEIKDALREVNNEGKTIFFSSHIVSDIEEVCKQVVIIEDGKSIYQGSTDKLIENNWDNEYMLRFCTDTEISANNLKRFDEIIDKNVEAGKFIYLAKISKKSKEELISYLVSEKSEILSLLPNRPRLEEVVYKIRE